MHENDPVTNGSNESAHANAEGGERTVVVTPAARPSTHSPAEVAEVVVKVKGPGRIERRYKARIAELEASERELESELGHARREVDVLELIERGSSRMLDRVEREREREREEFERLRQQSNRLLVTLGALQQENAELRSELAQAPREKTRRILGTKGRAD